jgi:hypothetical protein
MVSPVKIKKVERLDGTLAPFQRTALASPFSANRAKMIFLRDLSVSAQPSKLRSLSYIASGFLGAASGNPCHAS